MADPRAERAPSWQIWTALSIVYLVWGSTYLAIAISVQTMPPLLMAAIRFLLAGVFLFLVTKKRGSPPLTRKHWFSASVVGVALLLGGNGGVVVAEKTVSSGIASLMVAAIPMWFAIFAWLILRERITARAVIGILVGFAGIALLTWPSRTQAIDPFGAFLLILAPICWAAGSVYSKRGAVPQPAIVGTAMQMLAGGAALGIASALSGEWKALDLSSISTASWIAFVYLIVFGSLVAFTAYIWVLGHAPTSLVGTYAFVNPVVAVFLGWVVLDEKITTRVVLGAGIIVAGVASIVSAPTRRKIDIGSPADAPATTEA